MSFDSTVRVALTTVKAREFWLGLLPEMSSQYYPEGRPLGTVKDKCVWLNMVYEEVLKVGLADLFWSRLQSKVMGVFGRKYTALSITPWLSIPP